jgi:hypothetical protein
MSERRNGNDALQGLGALRLRCPSLAIWLCTNDALESALRKAKPNPAILDMQITRTPEMKKLNKFRIIEVTSSKLHIPKKVT